MTNMYFLLEKFPLHSTLSQSSENSIISILEEYCGHSISEGLDIHGFQYLWGLWMKGHARLPETTSGFQSHLGDMWPIQRSPIQSWEAHLVLWCVSPLDFIICRTYTLRGFRNRFPFVYLRTSVLIFYSLRTNHNRNSTKQIFSVFPLCLHFKVH